MQIKINKIRINLAICVLTLIVLIGFSPIIIAGDLQPPPGDPAPTMLPLDRVEPRTPISSLPFNITQPGSYYITGNLGPSGGITVDADNVTIDLMGFTIAGYSSGVNHGVYIDGHKNVEIRNGTIRNYSDQGVWSLDSLNCRGIRVLNVRVLDCGGSGISLVGPGNLVKNCTVIGSTKSGIKLSGGGTVKGNIVYGNSQNGISAWDGCMIAEYGL